MWNKQEVSLDKAVKAYNKKKAALVTALESVKLKETLKLCAQERAAQMQKKIEATEAEKK